MLYFRESRFHPGNGRIPASLKTKFWRRVAFVICGLAAGLVIAEISLRFIFADPESEAFRIWPPGLVQKFLPSKETMPGISDTSVFSVNSMGFRGSEYSQGDQMRILVLGGSTSECLYLDDDEAWPAVLEEILNQYSGDGSIWVGNGGRSGYSSRHHVLQAIHLFPQHPEMDLIVIMAGVNDFLRFLEGRENYNPVWEENEYLEKTFLVVPRNRYPAWFRRTAVWHLGRLAFRNMKSSFADENIQDESGDIYSKWRMARLTARKSLDNLPDLSVPLSEYEENLRRITTHARKSKMKILFIDQPVLWIANLEARLDSLLCAGSDGDRIPESAYYSAAALESGMLQFNDVMRKVAVEEKTGFLSISDSLPKSDIVFYDDMHFNEYGSAMVAKIVARWIIANGYLHQPNGNGQFSMCNIQ